MEMQEDYADDDKDDSGFEILSSDDGLPLDEYSENSAMWFGTLKDSFYESLKSSFSSQKTIEKMKDGNSIVSINFRNLTPHIQQTRALTNPDYILCQSQDTKNDFTRSAGDISDANCGNWSCNDESYLVQELSERDSPVFEMDEKIVRRYFPVEKVENYLEGKNFVNHQWAIDNEMVVANLVEDTGSQTMNNSLKLQTFEGGVNMHDENRRWDGDVQQMHADRRISPKKLCPLIKHSFKIYKWFRNNECLQNFIAGAKLSFHSFINMFELEMNLLLGMEDPSRILIIADTKDSNAIEEAFCESLRGQVLISKSQIQTDYTTVPILPVGYNSALQVVQSKINDARQRLRDSEKMVMIASAIFIVEIIPERWQTSTVLYLEDPNLQLSLYNFTSTIPVPNEYVHQAQRLTPENYPLKKRGLAVTLEDAIREINTVKTHSKNTGEFLSGINRHVNVKSTADILADIYKKYADKLA